MAEKEPIGVIGVGWVGLVTAACLAELGHEVWARDIVPEKIESLSRGEVPFHEPGLPELVTKNASRLHFTTLMSEAAERPRLLFCCVDTPPTYSGDADLSRVEAVIEELGDSTDHALVMKSTVPVGTGRSIQRRREGLGYVSNPEFLKEGVAVDDFMRPDRVVIGAGEESEAYADRVEALYEPLGGTILRTDVASAEMIKLASNAFLATKISFINEVANVSEELGADVLKVAEGMGMDDRIGPKFLRAGIGWGGSCLVGEETVLVRRQGRTTLLTFEQLWRRLEDEESGEDGVIEPDDVEVLSWAPEWTEPRFLPVTAATRRDFEGDLVEVRTEMGRRVRCTPDHPWVVDDGRGDDVEVKLAEDLATGDWVPVVQKAPDDGAAVAAAPLACAVRAGGVNDDQAIVRVPPERSEVLSTHRSPAPRAGVLRTEPATDAALWRVVGLYLAGGQTATEPGRTGIRHRIIWSFHPAAEQHLVDEVVAFWMRHGVEARTYDDGTSKVVSVSSGPLGAWWTRELGLGRDSYEQRVPDLIWDRPAADKWALLSGLWEGDGSWEAVCGGPSVTIELGTVSDELADGALRLLGDLGVMAGHRIARTTKPIRDTHLLTISGADQVERALPLVRERDRGRVCELIAGQTKRVAPTGYRRLSEGHAWTRIVSAERKPFSGPVYSLEVPGAHTFVTTGGVVVHNCFGKDVLSLKQLASNTGYHFQLLTAVTEVNDLQKRRTVGKLQKHLGSLVGKTIALLGIAFKPDTDDIRDATSLVLGARLLGEGAHVRAYDPVAADKAREVLVGTELCETALDAVEGADAVVLVTEWPEFRELDWAGEVKRRLKRPVVIDGRNFLDREALVEAGYTYEGVGR